MTRQGCRDERGTILGARGRALAASCLLLCGTTGRADAKPPQPRHLRATIARAQIQALRSGDDEVRILAAQRLRGCADALPEDALAALRTATADRLAVVRLEAVMGLGALLTSGVEARRVLAGVAKSDASQAVRMEAAAVLRELRPDLQGALRAAGVKHPGLLFRAVPGAPTPRLRSVPREAVPGLVRLLRHKDPALRVGAIGALQTVERPPLQAVWSLIHTLRDGDPLVGSAAASALCNLDELPGGAQSRILATLASRYWKTRQGIVQLLGKVHLPDSKTVAALTSAMTDETDYVASSAACTLADLCRTRPGLCRGVDAGLLTALERGHPETRRCAAHALRTTGCKDPRLVPLLVRALSSRYAELRHESVQTLATLGRAAGPAVPALIGLLKNKVVDHAVVKAALKSIGTAAALRAAGE